MKIHSFILFAAVLLLALETHGEDKGQEDVAKLTGTWACISAVNDGKALAEGTAQKLRLTLTKDRGYKTERGKQVLFDSTYKIDPSKQPKHIDLIGTEGENKGKTAQGIFVLEDDRLKICYTMPGKERPKEFESKPGSGATLIIWKRLKQ